MKVAFQNNGAVIVTDNFRVYIGWDQREPIAYDVAKFSLSDGRLFRLKSCRSSSADIRFAARRAD
jgi:hypothetical protein